MNIKQSAMVPYRQFKPIACFDKMRGIYMPLISPTPEVLKDIQDICVLQDKLYALTSNVIVELKMEKNADEIRLTANRL